MKIKFSFSATSPLRALLSPYPARDWGIVLAASALLFIVSLVCALYLFLSVRAEAEMRAAPSLTEVQNDAFRDLPAVLEKYQIQKERFNAGTFSAPALTDPNK